MLLANKKDAISFSATIDAIHNSTKNHVLETTAAKARRIKTLLANYETFCHYYFPEYCYAPFAAFHKQIQQNIAERPNHIFLEQWSRGFAKSTHLGLFLPLYLKCKGKLNGMIVGSLNEDMAGTKLDDLQANLQANQRLINDFGEQYRYGSWEDGEFVTKDGVPFYAFGKMQTPRGFRFKWKRPNYGLVDDLNDARQLKNQAIAQEDKRWVMEELKPALWTREWWLVIAQNKFHDQAVTTLLELDEEIQTTTHRVNILDENGESNWPENPDFAKAAIANIKASEGAGFIRERMNTPFEEGTTFKAEWLNHWVQPLPADKYDGVLIHYLDPSYKSTDKSDYKFWILLGKKEINYDILDAWGEKTTSKNMWEHAYQINEEYDTANIKHCIEASFIQDELHGRELDRVAAEKGYMLRVNYDKRSKGDKFQRIETLQPLFQRGLIRFNIEKKDTTGMKLLRAQLLAIEKGSRLNDDGPDALEGAIWMADKNNSRATHGTRSGQYHKPTIRAM
ncbi:hypothetical protein [Parasediminibacterium sp. JCM 36343]|uniref:hypothetical protein n=1 Tax=Parasediminibacterium sp. JCM 36343 TaxID=3374279 RepID=UPI0039798C6D